MTANNGFAVMADWKAFDEAEATRYEEDYKQYFTEVKK